MTGGKVSIRRFAVCLAVCLTLAASWASPASAAEWPRFRGPNGGGQAQAAAIPAQWTERDYRWRVDLPGLGHSSPVVAANHVVVTSADPENATLYVLSFQAQTGALQWRAEFPSAQHHLHARNSYATSTPAVDDERVYVAWASPEQYTVAALDLSTGRVVWRHDLGPFQSQHGFGASPIVYRDMLIVANDQDGASFLTALDVRTGQPRWKTNRRGGRTSYSAPCVWQEPGRPDELIFTSSENGMTGVDAQSGKVDWSLDVFPLRTIASPIVAGGLVLASCGEGSGGKTVVAVRPPAGNQPARVEYQITDGAPYVTTPIACGDLLFICHDRGTASCHELSTGKRLWNKRLESNFSGSPVCVGDRLYCIAENGDVVVLAASRKFQVLARNPLGQPSRATPAVAAGRMFLRTESKLFCIGP